MLAVDLNPRNVYDDAIFREQHGRAAGEFPRHRKVKAGIKKSRNRDNKHM